MLDPHKDREPGYDARVITTAPDQPEMEWAKSPDDGNWWTLGFDWFAGLPWHELATEYPDGLVWLP